MLKNIRNQPLRLVVLNACEGARGGKRDIFSSTASILIEQGVPAVLAMQYEISDKAAVEFSRSFYEAIADGWPVDAATSEARMAIRLEAGNSFEWGTPVLFMRAPDGLLFKLQPRDREREERERRAQEQAEQERLAAEELAREQAEAERQEAERTEQERLAKEQAEKERLSQAKAEQERLAAEKLAREKAEAERRAQEQAEQERLARSAAHPTVLP